MASHTVTTVWKENMQFETDNPSGHKTFIDVGEENGGKVTSALKRMIAWVSSNATVVGIAKHMLLERLNVMEQNKSS